VTTIRIGSRCLPCPEAILPAPLTIPTTLHAGLERRIIRPCNGIIHIAIAENRQNRPELLFDHETRGVRDVADYRQSYEIAFPLQRFAPGDDKRRLASRLQGNL
jgi:hypothetical protein